MHPIEGGDQIVQARIHEEDEAKHVLAELDSLGIDHPEFTGKFATFAAAVLADAEREEAEEFPGVAPHHIATSAESDG